MNHSESFRRCIRTVLGGLLVTVLCIYFSAPRLLVKSKSNWVPSRSSDLDAFVDTNMVGPATSQVTAVDSSDPNAGTQVFEDSVFVWSVAGFPFDAVHIQRRGEEVRYHASVSAVLLNALALVVIIGGAIGFVYFNEVKSHLRSQFVIAWASVVCVFAVGSGWEIVIANQHTKVIKQYGDIVQRESVQHPLFQMLPNAVRVAWTHCYSFRQNESFQSVSDVACLSTCLAEHAELHVVQLSEDLSDAVRKDLRDLPFLHTLACRRLTSLEGLQFLTRNLPSLHSLQASLVTIGDRSERVAVGERLPSIDFRHMQELQHLSVMGIDLSDFASESFSVASLKTLSIELSDANSLPLSLRDHRNLRKLNVASGAKGNTCVAIELVNLPSLTSLGTPRFRPVDLKIHQTPRLQNIFATFGGGNYVTFSPTDTPPWIRSLEIQNAASLPALAATVDSPQHWIVEECPNLRTLVIQHPSPRRQSLLGMAQGSRDLGAIWDWMKGPLPINQISLDRVDLRGVDLSDWKEMRYLERVALKRCNTHPGQLRQLTKLDRLNEILAPEIAIDSVTADELLASRNNWVKLNVDWSRVQSIRISDQSKLIAAFDSKELWASEIELENLPRLHATLTINGNSTRLKLNNLPLVQSIVINGMMPQATELGGLPNLRTFCVRGSTLGEEHLQFLRNSSLIHSLYLPQCSVTQDFLTGLSQLSRLNTIDLSGLRVVVDRNGREVRRAICDEDTVNFRQLDSLTALNLDGSEIGVETLARLTACRRLQAVSLQDCPLSGDQLLPLTVSDSLLELRVARSTPVPERLSESVDVDRGDQLNERFVVNWVTQATSQYVRRPSRGGNSTERMPLAFAADERSRALIARPFSDEAEARTMAVERDVPEERSLHRRRPRRRMANRNSNS